MQTRQQWERSIHEKGEKKTEQNSIINLSRHQKMDINRDIISKYLALAYTFTVAGLIRNLAPAFIADLASSAFKTVPTCFSSYVKITSGAMLVTDNKHIFYTISGIVFLIHGLASFRNYNTFRLYLLLMKHCIAKEKQHSVALCL